MLVTSGPPGFWWDRLSERSDPTALRQEHDLYCIPACLQMLLGPRSPSQDALADRLHCDPSIGINPNHVLPFLQLLDGPHKWSDDLFPTAADISFLHAAAPWLAFLITRGKPKWHAVIVDGIDNNRLVRIRDPLTATAYIMPPPHFDDAWSGYAIFSTSPAKKARPTRRKTRRK